MGIFTKRVDQPKSRPSQSFKRPSWWLWLIFVIALLAFFFDYPAAWNKPADWLSGQIGISKKLYFFERPFRLGLDLQGGTHLVYQADLSNIEPQDYSASMQGVRDVIERRINLFGVAEPVVQINRAGQDYRLIVELAGVKDIHQAIEMIGQTPALDFREERQPAETERLLAEQKEIEEKLNQGQELTEEEKQKLIINPYFKPTNLTGRYLKGAELSLNQKTSQAQVNLEFNSEGGRIFEELTKKNVGKRLAIFLDNAVISAPVVQEAISGGKAQITGNFTYSEAKELVQRLNAGALPVPINLISQQTIGASLGRFSLDKSLKAGLWGFLLVLLFLIIYYRLPGLLASLALVIYLIFLLAIFKLIPVTLTLAGIAGVILSIGMAVDANVLIFERLKEELRSGRGLSSAIDEAFGRAWLAIRDGNLSTIITCIILYIFATGLIKGFALTLGLGILLSMFSAIVITKGLLRYFTGRSLERWKSLWL